MNKFIFNLGVLTLGLITGTLLVWLDYFSGANFLRNFIGNDLIQTIGVILGLNVSATVFLLGQIYTVEKKFALVDFDDVRTEVRDNTYSLFIAFALSLVLLVVRPEFIEGAGFSINKLFYTVNAILLGSMSLSIYALFQLFEAAFQLSKHIPSSTE